MVARLSEELSLALGISPSKAKLIGNASALHDIGKIAVPEKILNKRGKLTPKEFGIIKTHTTIGAQMLSTMQGSLGKLAYSIALLHHEDWLGTGYWGISADHLPSHISIVTTVDTYVALISKRPYKKAWTQKDALSYLHTHTGTKFSPEIIKVFSKLIEGKDAVC